MEREIKTWYKKVYKVKKGKLFSSKRWKRTRERVLERDLYMCVMCYSEKCLQAHHIKPRKLGGKNTMRNLITLCNKCHDIAEEKGFTRKIIINYSKECPRKDDNIKDSEKVAKNWQQWVYGGYSIPQKGK